MIWNPFTAMNPSGFGQQTAAGRVLQSGMGSTRAAPGRRKRKASKKRAVRARRASPAKRATRRARLVKGSAAAKAYMAKIRRKRRK